MKNFTNFTALIVSLCLDYIKTYGEEFHFNNDTDSRGFSTLETSDTDLYSFEAQYKGTHVLGLITPNVPLIEAEHKNGMCPIVLRIYNADELMSVAGALDNEGFFTRIPSDNEITPLCMMNSDGVIAYKNNVENKCMCNPYQSISEGKARGLAFSAAFNTPLIEE